MTRYVEAERVKIAKTTALALLLEFEGGSACWVPRSQVRGGADLRQARTTTTAFVSAWFVSKDAAFADAVKRSAKRVAEKKAAELAMAKTLAAEPVILRTYGECAESAAGKFGAWAWRATRAGKLLNSDRGAAFDICYCASDELAEAVAVMSGYGWLTSFFDRSGSERPAVRVIFGRAGTEQVVRDVAGSDWSGAAGFRAGLNVLAYKPFGFAADSDLKEECDVIVIRQKPAPYAAKVEAAPRSAILTEPLRRPIVLED